MDLGVKAVRRVERRACLIDMEGSQVSVWAQAPPLSGVVFHNVARSYIPDTRVECHYTLTARHRWAARDWIGIFKVGWSSVRDYHTFVWSLAPDNYEEGQAANCSVQFQASYLPKASADPFQFCYVSSGGEVSARSPPFTFRTPTPLEELVAVEGGEWENGDDMLVVIPRAEMLQSRLEACLQERAGLLAEREESERQKDALTERVRERERGVERAEEEKRRLQQQYEEVMREKEEVTSERDALICQRAENQERIIELEEDMKIINRKVLERETELDRMKDRVKKLSFQHEQLSKQLREEEEEKERLQLKLRSSELELRRLAADFQTLRSSLAERDTQALQLRDEISKLQSKLSTALENKEYTVLLREQLRCSQDQLSASQQKAELLGAELGSAAAMRDRTMSELHKARLEGAELNIQLAQGTLAWKEDRAQWLKERIALLQSSEVQLGETVRELKELKSTLRISQKEKEQLLAEKQELLQYMQKLEQRLDSVANSKWKDAVSETPSRPDSPLLNSEDESPEDMRPPRERSAYSLCDNTAVATETPGFQTPPPSPRQPARGGVVISQPAPIASHLPVGGTETDSSDSEDDEDEQEEPSALSVTSSGDETSPLLPELEHALQHTAPCPARQSSSAQWKECPICSERFPLEFHKEALQQHVDSHFYYSLPHEPFTFQ
ncbi:calcium-binding and coiled-coil domain-containing protein 1-like isoform X3 [Acipenser ruthenus]|uniref:calcium-binding and coiled-coil domain-containing protein 1-like isoform X3 n=1 Tax=Acipenser ruthenus TaxID=7906 RepID=UPI0027415CE9|nr:calcium-binding and coiled-coil domain-containing protein 1-like isoform X3 [Acipenser ruthenus]